MGDRVPSGIRFHPGGSIESAIVAKRGGRRKTVGHEESQRTSSSRIVAAEGCASLGVEVSPHWNDQACSCRIAHAHRANRRRYCGNRRGSDWIGEPSSVVAGGDRTWLERDVRQQVTTRERPAYVSEFAKQLAGGEPVQLHCRVDGGYGIDGVLVATDQRLVYAHPVPRGRSREVQWTVPYCEITFLTTQGRGEAPGVVLLLQAGGDEYVAAPVWSNDAKALSEVVARNRPETAEPIVIRLGDNPFKKMVRGVRPSSREGSKPRGR